MEFENKIIQENLLPDFTEPTLYHVDSKYLYVRLLRTLFFFLIGYGVVYALFHNITELQPYSTQITTLFLMLFLVRILFVKKGVDKMRYAFRTHDLIYKSGVIQESTTIVPYQNIQHFAIQQDYFSKLFHLKSIKVYTSGGDVFDIIIPGLSNENANRYAQLLSDIISKKNNTSENEQ